MAPSVKRPTLDLSSGHDLTVGERERCVGLCANLRIMLGILSPPQKKKKKTSLMI